MDVGPKAFVPRISGNPIRIRMLRLNEQQCRAFKRSSVQAQSVEVLKLSSAERNIRSRYPPTTVCAGHEA